MKIGQWLSTHPPIASRLAALAPNLGDPTGLGRSATFGALFVIALVVLLPPAVGGFFVVRWWPAFKAQIEQQKEQQEAAANAGADPLRAEVETSIMSLVQTAEGSRASRDAIPRDADSLYTAWAVEHPSEAPPLDPYCGARLGYRVQGDQYVIWSVGPDPVDDRDDIYYESASQPDAPPAK